MKKLLLICSNSNHLKSYFDLVKDYFDEILIVSNSEVDFCKHKILSFQLKNPALVWKEIRSLRNTITEFSPSVIHVHQANSFGFIAAIANKKRFPLVLTAWGSDVLLLPQQNRLLRCVVKTALSKADVITADAEFMAKAIEGLVENKKIIIANFGIELNPEVTNEIKKEKIIYSNRLHKELYNINQVILGSSKFLSKNKEWKLIIGGNGELTKSLQLLASKYLPTNSYEFIGFVSSEVNKRFYQSASIYVSIPQSDGTAVSLLEAMAYGCIPVVSDLPANKEWIKNQENGIVTSPGDLEKALDEALNLDLDRVAEINLQIIKQKATKEANKTIFIRMYQSLAV